MKGVGTLQDRLVKEMRLAGVKRVEQANEFLKTYLPTFNRKFKVKPVSEVDVHQPALPMRELDKIFCIRDERTLRNDFTIVYNGRLYQIKDAIKSQKVAVEERIDGSLILPKTGHFYFGLTNPFTQNRLTFKLTSGTYITTTE